MSRTPASVSRRLTTATLRRAARELARRDRDLARILAAHGPPPMWGRPTGFATLVHIILEQQVSLAGARTLNRRLREHLGEITPATVTRCREAGLRAFGLTRQKARYVHALAEAVRDGHLDLGRVARLPDHEAHQALLALPGIGPWSVAIYQLMALRRPDIWPDGDLALAAAMARVKGLAHLPGRLEQQAIAAAWAPWRSVGARMLWQQYLAERRPA